MVKKVIYKSSHSVNVPILLLLFHQFQFSPSVVSDPETPWTAAHQASLSITSSRSLLKLMPIELVMSPTHLILCCPFSSCLQSFPASGSFPVSQVFASGGQSFGASASASDLPLELTGLVSLLSKDLFYDRKQSGEKEYYFISAIKISSIDNPAVSYVFPNSFKSQCVKMTVLIKE